MKALQSSLELLESAEEQENQAHWEIAREVYQTLQGDVQWRRMHSRETCERKKR